jgi:archaellum biogenesis ATPase FlaH
MELTNKSNLPNVIKRAVANDPYDSSGSDISTTRLITPPRIRVLEARHWENLTEDVADKIFALLGSSVHHVIERAVTDEDIAELRLFHEVNGWTLSGQFDLLTAKGELIDFKVTSAWSALDALKNGKAEWEQQLNVLDYLSRHTDHSLKNYLGKTLKVKSLSIMAILRDWSKMKTMTSKDYPRKQVVMIPVRQWSEEEQDNFVLARIKAHQEAEVGELPVCSAKERWRKDDKYAIMKDGRKTALRLLDTKDQVKQYLKDNKLVEGKGCTVVLRAGEDIRCQSYCRVNSFCDYFMEKSVEF